jgi:hypothetical protein
MNKVQALQYRLDFVLVSILLQSSEGIKALVKQLLIIGRLCAECTDSHGTVSVWSLDGRLNLSMSPRATHRHKETQEEHACPIALSGEPALGFRRHIPVSFHMRIVASSPQVVNRCKTLSLSLSLSLLLLLSLSLSRVSATATT